MPASNGSLTGMDPARVLGWLAWLSGLVAGLGRAFGRDFLGTNSHLVVHLFQVHIFFGWGIAGERPALSLKVCVCDL
jgi:hypothetical protein